MTTTARPTTSNARVSLSSAAPPLGQDERGEMTSPNSFGTAGLAEGISSQRNGNKPFPSLHICLVAPSTKATGGQAVQAAALLHLLQAEGVTVTHVAPDAQLPDPLRQAARVPGLRTLLRHLCFIPALGCAIRNVDVVHVFTPSFFAFNLLVVPALLLSRRHRRPLLIHYHSGHAGDHLRKWWYGALPLLRRADQIVAPSSFLGDLFGRYGLRATVVPNVVDLSRFHDCGSRITDVNSSTPQSAFRHSRPSSPLSLLCTRNLEPLYNIECILRAFERVQAELPDSTLTLVGSGSEEGRLRTLAEQLRLKEVRFVGAVAHDAIPSFYAAADLFVNSSNVDNMPVSILEAFAAGVPVVTTDAGGIPWLVQDGVTGLLVPRNDPAALAEAVLRLARDRERAAALARAARSEVQRYSWEAARMGWWQIYTSLCPQTEGHS